MNPYENYSVRALEAWLASSALEITRIREALEVAKERENPPKPITCYVLRDVAGNVFGCRIDLRVGHPIMGDTRPHVTNISRATASAGKWWVKVNEVE
jgi:hypothetical protein